MHQIAYNTTAMQAARTKTFGLVGLQLIAVFALALCWGFVDTAAAISALLGGVASVLPSFYFAYRFFAAGNTKAVSKILKAFYWGECIKLLLSACLVIIILSEIRVSILPFFTGFVGAHMGFWLAPLLAVTDARVAD